LNLQYQVLLAQNAKQPATWTAQKVGTTGEQIDTGADETSCLMVRDDRVLDISIEDRDAAQARRRAGYRATASMVTRVSEPYPDVGCTTKAWVTPCASSTAMSCSTAAVSWAPGLYDAFGLYGKRPGSKT
jgi:hypothetical protein